MCLGIIVKIFLSLRHLPTAFRLLNNISVQGGSEKPGMFLRFEDFMVSRTLTVIS